MEGICIRIVVVLTPNGQFSYFETHEIKEFCIDLKQLSTWNSTEKLLFAYCLISVDVIALSLFLCNVMNWSSALLFSITY